MFFVYVLKSRFENYFYVGLTNSLERRLKQHEQGKSRSTRSRRPFDLYSVDIFDNRQDARTHEKKLKSGFSREKRKIETRTPACRQAGLRGVWGNP
jgi:putative endonuclease